MLFKRKSLGNVTLGLVNSVAQNDMREPGSFHFNAPSSSEHQTGSHCDCRMTFTDPSVILRYDMSRGRREGPFPYPSLCFNLLTASLGICDLSSPTRDGTSTLCPGHMKS